ncbi:MAG: 30S ribosomal protein S8 [Candidatus Levybacteria bacterium]|nr:30S ribosomal protein S8 [Candidatus Levybacteria bacterium]
MNYTVADFIIQIKNAYMGNRKTVTAPYSNITKAIGQLLVKKQLLSEVKEETIDGKRILIASLRYVRRRPAFTQVEVISKPSLRVHIDVQTLPTVLRDDALAVVSTSQGVMSGTEAHKKHIGGELLFKIR